MKPAGVAVLVPMLQTTAERGRAFVLVRRHLAPWPAITCPDPEIGGAVDERRFSRARAVNRATRLSLYGWGRVDTIVINDADSLCPHEQIVSAVELARAEPGLVYAYTTYHRLTEKATAAVYDDDFRPPLELALDGPFERELVQPPAQGCAAITLEAWEELGGYDESFEGWGYEDVDLAHRAGLLHPVRRVTGPLVHLWHGSRRPDDSPLESDPALVAANLARWNATA